MENGDNTKKLAVVTGGVGFVGSHLCERLVRDGYRVISLEITISPVHPQIT